MESPPPLVEPTPPPLDPLPPPPEELPINEHDYGEFHRRVLQGLIAAGFLDAKGVKDLFLRVCTTMNMSEEEKIEKTNMMSVHKVVREINEKLKQFDMSTRSACCEQSGKKFYVFLITAEKPIMKLLQIFSKHDLQFFNKIMTEVLTKYENYAIPYMRCLNMASEIDSKYSKVQAEEFMNTMMRLLYLDKFIPDPEEPDDFEVTLGVRTIREFESILRQSYPVAFQNCFLCRIIMLHGKDCCKCDAHLHNACVDKYKKTCPTCPSCRISWKVENTLLRRTNVTAPKNSNTGLIPSCQKTRKSAETKTKTLPSKSQSSKQTKPGTSTRSRAAIASTSADAVARSCEDAIARASDEAKASAAAKAIAAATAIASAAEIPSTSAAPIVSKSVAAIATQIAAAYVSTGGAAFARTSPVASTSAAAMANLSPPAAETTPPLDTLDLDSTPPLASPVKKGKNQKKSRSPSRKTTAAAKSKIASKQKKSTDAGSDEIPTKKQALEATQPTRESRARRSTQKPISYTESSDERSSAELSPETTPTSASTPTKKRAVTKKATKKTVSAEENIEDMPVLELMLPSTPIQPQQGKGKKPTAAKTTPKRRVTRATKVSTPTSDERDDDKEEGGKNDQSE